MENGGRGSGGVELRMTNLRFFSLKANSRNQKKTNSLFVPV